MDISKAIKKERNDYRKFKAIMIIIFVLLPIVTLFLGMTDLFYVIYLIILEVMIILSLMIRSNWERLEYSCSYNRFKYKAGLFSSEGLIFCDKVALVHTEKRGEEMNVIIVSSVNFKNKYFKLVDGNILKRYPDFAEEYLKVKKLNPENTYYYVFIRKGSLKKYMLLDTMFKNCVKAVFSSNAIENIKISRGQKEL